MLRFSIVPLLFAAGLITGCGTSQKMPAVADNIRKSLDQSGLKNVSVSQDRDKGVVTLAGNVGTDADKARASQLAQSMAAGQVVANEVAVLPPTDQGPTKTFYTDLDKGIGSNLDAALISNRYDGLIRHSVKNEVVTLTGTVDTDAERSQVETIAHGIPNVQQVVNEIQTRHQKATSSN